MNLNDILSILRQTFNLLLGILVLLAMISSLEFIEQPPIDLLDLAFVTTFVGAAGYSPVIWSRLKGDEVAPDVSTKDSKDSKSPNGQTEEE